MKILAPVDRSQRDSIALPYCVELGEELNAEITLLHVVAVNKSLVPGSMREAEAYVGAVQECLSEQGVKVASVLRRGDPAAAIVEAVGELGIDLLVMTSRGRSGLGKLILGSVTDAVLASCSKPVILLSEAANGKSVDEVVRRRSAYLATFIWNKKARGFYSEAEARAELDRLALSGLDRSVLQSTFARLEEQGIAMNWLDIEFQMESLRTYLPQEVGEDNLPQLPGLRAA
jgi:nucleotide-binding universal stress UspA family protein